MSDETMQEVKVVDTAEVPKPEAVPKFGDKAVAIAAIVFSAVALGALYLL